ncbi:MULTISPECIES: nucleotidyl transferase AbiEii/AbiGii toxin family protein [Bradyrhizobium]|uniref:Nucleotidyl transferase AbiEii/AbiGii toxin family protein n=2 Tax=Bradyrhizobium TaxID=374 RepID=A0A9X1UBK0_9BRAD|nr:MULTISPECIES: nucleotidyl transferase AbiEii/AbiGii toxin family protein [Bradyrhizobium]MCG2629444.1 nucleotidyl transferase AbiEii/AbiGii toxin family protein [Bradyrhizobium zhengyangense]MCG2644928.1 nucleotidyl transferase AbiEii/AbiGii toxin family protein [Bradyrhizobium zhengyangense]MCG2670958.1 nucleotidyl transferase AbiEii/AbiGii toxin family protein [Bradyrhizobium zhengyangense]MDN4984592.1 nucleotidyl transferase AbiEii/AbiGii toxin family protein [Bradyrhizobium sp. WYCCWR 13
MTDLPQIIRASAEDRRGLFQQTGQRLSCPPENIEKDFWVCWILDALYNKAGIEQRLLFKGGTSLSKAFDLIQRFSEDIDITVFRDDLPGENFPSDDDLRAMGSNERKRKLDEIKERCSSFINGEFQNALTNFAAGELEGLTFKIEPDPDDPDAQSLLFHYPSAFADSDERYVRRVVKIESGAKSALDPHETKTISPYSATDTDGLDLTVPNVLTIKPERTFWDKIIILHGQRHWFQNRGELYKDGQRLSRHYYDIFRLLTSEHGEAALKDLELAESCVRHARLYFNRKPLDLDQATPGTFGIVPVDGMLEPLKADYQKMAGMIFGGSLLSRISSARLKQPKRP